ncbi:hypothetical protein [Oricola cellulosilytica]|uniref:Uncharacterized protein n=1 Tax=Oricola cellulosilytica TaxID=1429082 RepID=A0A4R0PFN5_9HYPH|nr:hypothetical protein [Oricola cellulosilytica]TCD16451.1 hypothetical protein E0D97_03225 [Oricola cellulosilytica]
MQSANRLKREFDRPVTYLRGPMAAEIHRSGWEALSNLGMSDDEIAAYYGSGKRLLQKKRNVSGHIVDPRETPRH